MRVPEKSFVTNETEDGLPRDVHEMAGLKDKVIAWTTLDPEFAPDVGASAFCNSFGVYLFLPCLLPQLLFAWPIHCAEKTAYEYTLRNQYWILTETELKVVTRDHKCSSCCTGKLVKTIPLEEISISGSVTAGNGCVNECCQELPFLYVSTASFWPDEHTLHEAMGYGLARQDWFIREVLNRRDIVVATPVMERGDSPGSATNHMKDFTELRNSGVLKDVLRTATDRMNDIIELHNSGVLTREEFLQKRKCIIDSI
ncbi:hypothetical protein MHU86_25712 [Fragilaria crotonensis]|nr:hypothetical protein MHU86_25712 [Fragilaria crotonensis]